MKKIMKIIVYTGVIISLIPIITMFCINLRQNKIETDRNFYGKEITEGLVFFFPAVLYRSDHKDH